MKKKTNFKNKELINVPYWMQWDKLSTSFPEFFYFLYKQL